MQFFVCLNKNTVLLLLESTCLHTEVILPFLNYVSSLYSPSICLHWTVQVLVFNQWYYLFNKSGVGNLSLLLGHIRLDLHDVKWCRFPSIICFKNRHSFVSKAFTLDNKSASNLPLSCSFKLSSLKYVVIFTINARDIIHFLSDSCGTMFSCSVMLTSISSHKLRNLLETACLVSYLNVRILWIYFLQEFLKLMVFLTVVVNVVHSWNHGVPNIWMTESFWIICFLNIFCWTAKKAVSLVILFL